MKSTVPTPRHRALILPVLGLLAAAESIPATLPTVAVVTTAALSLSGTQQAQAMPVHRVARRTSRRTTRRVVRRHMFVLPAAAAAVTFGPYRYYRCGGVYYYPYMIKGTTTYIEIDVDVSGNPTPPPPASQIELEVDIH